MVKDAKDEDDMMKRVQQKEDANGSADSCGVLSTRIN
jgi:hypothetical protein